MGVIVNADGTLESAPAVIAPNTANYQLLGDLALLPDGRVFMTLTDTSGALVNGVAGPCSAGRCLTHLAQRQQVAVVRQLHLASWS